mmetsp:Transcript_37153/g.116948  ORF Transcript_37153/g.116948 Transcript_37153/m.116948 type:complete len:102 (-) Transcript_37153:510-815(-)
MGPRRRASDCSPGSMPSRTFRKSQELKRHSLDQEPRAEGTEAPSSSPLASSSPDLNPSSLLGEGFQTSEPESIFIFVPRNIVGDGVRRLEHQFRGGAEGLV